MDIPDFPYKMPILNRMFTDAHYLLGLEDRLKGFDLVHTAETYFRYTQQCLDAKKKGYVKKVIATVLETIRLTTKAFGGGKHTRRGQGANSIISSRLPKRPRRRLFLKERTRKKSR